MSHLRVSGPSGTVIEYPDCPNCRIEMSLVRRSPAMPDMEIRIFECAKCLLQNDLLVNIDPMKSVAAGWANSHLEKPQ
jgi:hypothetical protein